MANINSKIINLAIFSPQWYICSNKFGVHETNFSFAQFNRIRSFSLDAGLRMDGIPIIKHTHTPTLETKISMAILNYAVSIMFSSNVNSSHFGAMRYMLEDIEAVMKMIINGRSPTMRHVSRTHTVALDWLFDRINFVPEDPNQIC